MSSARPTSPIQKFKKKVATAVKISSCSKSNDLPTQVDPINKLLCHLVDILDRIHQRYRVAVSVLRLTRARLTALAKLSAALGNDERVPKGESFLSQKVKEHLKIMESLIEAELLRIDNDQKYSDFKKMHDEYAEAHKDLFPMESLTESDVAKIMNECDEVAVFAEIWPGQEVKAKMLRMTVSRLNILKNMVSYITSLQGVPEIYTAANSMLDAQFVANLEKEREHVGNETSEIQNWNWGLGVVPGKDHKTVQSEAVRLADEDYEFVGRIVLCRLAPECIGWAFDGK